MHTEEIHKIPVHFPFEPYECQKKLMETVIKAIDQQGHAAIESPTGTGKTLSLLCASLAWLGRYKETARGKMSEIMAGLVDPGGQGNTNAQLFPKIFYASRTHSQLQQVIRELNKTVYNSVSTCILASREQLCVNDRVIKESNNQIKGQICRDLVKRRKCVFYNTLDQAKVADAMYKAEAPGALDIEDLVTVAKKFKHCPYFRTQQVFETADLVLLPYNYIFDPKIRNVMKIDLKGNIVIIDEAHNLESVCEDSVSIEWSAKDNALAIGEARKVLTLLIEEEEEKRLEGDESNVQFHQLGRGKNDLFDSEKKEQPKLTETDVAMLLERLLDLDEAITVLGKEPVTAETRVDGIEGAVYPGEKMVALLESVGFLRLMRQAVTNVIDQIGQYLASQASENSGLWAERGTKLAEFSTLISRVFADSFEVGASGSIETTSANEATKMFLLLVDKDDDNTRLRYWCFSAGMAMRLVDSRGPRSIIVASGTLTPLKQYIDSLGINFLYTLENDHIATASQVLVGALRRSPTGEDLLGTYQKRSTAGYLDGLAQTLMRTMEATPQGMLVFFASYKMMDDIVQALKSRSYAGTTYWNVLEGLKKLVIEPRNKAELISNLTVFDQAVRSGKGAALFAVCRGKVSEGIDLPDSHCRAVVIVGIPYAPPNDPRIVLKKHFLRGSGTMSPEAWYQLESLRAVNQAIGRVIRHREDFGVVVLADCRFASMPQSNLSTWLRPSLIAYNDAEAFFTGCARFFSERGFLIQKSIEKLKKEESTMGVTVRTNKMVDGGWEKAQKEQKTVAALANLTAMYADSQESPEPSTCCSTSCSSSSKPGYLTVSSAMRQSQPSATRQRPRIKVQSYAHDKSYFQATPSGGAPKTLKTSPITSVPVPVPGTSSSSSTSSAAAAATVAPVQKEERKPLFKPAVIPLKRKQASKTTENQDNAIIGSNWGGGGGSGPGTAKKSKVDGLAVVEYRQKIKLLQDPLKTQLLTALRTYASQRDLAAVLPTLRFAASIDAAFLTGFRNFVRPEHESVFDAVCRKHGFS